MKLDYHTSERTEPPRRTRSVWFVLALMLLIPACLWLLLALFIQLGIVRE